jgi:hypothetical protein
VGHQLHVVTPDIRIDAVLSWGSYAHVANISLKSGECRAFAPIRPSLFPCVPAGVSLRTQELYALVFITRYLDLFTNFVSV